MVEGPITRIAPAMNPPATQADPVLRLCDVVRETAFAMHGYLRPGHLEKVYENGLAGRLRRQGLAVQQQCPLQVRDRDGTLLGDYYADLLVQGFLIVEIKAVRRLAEEHLAQILGYLRASRMEHGLLINFGGARLEIRKLVLAGENSEEVRGFEELAAIDRKRSAQNPGVN